MRFINRAEAGYRLVSELEEFRNSENIIVLGIPRGGAVTAVIIASELDLPVDLIFVKKIGFPTNKELAVGAVTVDDYFIDESIDLDPEYVENEISRLRDELVRKNRIYYSFGQPLSLEGKTVILTDDGLATGNTVKMAISLIRKKNPKEIILAVPVAPKRTVEELRPLVDQLICLQIPKRFIAIGNHYVDFGQISDQMVVSLLNSSNIKRA